MANFNILANLKKAIVEIEQSVYPTLKDVLNAYSSALKEIQNQDQLYNKGQNSKTISIVPSYAKSTIDYKLKKGQPIDRVTLKDSGKFYDSVVFYANSTSLIIEASAEYTKFLTSKYGIDIFGVQEMEFEKFYDKYIKKELDNKITDIINKNAL